MDVLAFLIEIGAGVIERDEKGRDALSWAVHEGKTKAVELLLKAGCEPDRVDKNGMTAAMWAAKRGRYECLVALGARGADLTLKHENLGWSLAQYAAEGWAGNSEAPDADYGRCLALAIAAGCDTGPDRRGVSLELLARGSPACLGILWAHQEAAELGASLVGNLPSARAPSL